MNIGSKIGVKQDGQDFGCMRNHGDSSRLRTTTSTSSGFTNSSKNSNNYNGFFSSSSNALDGHLTSEPWIESCVEPSFLSSPPPLPSNNSGNSKFSVFGDPVQSSFSSYSDSNSHQSTNNTESFWNSSNRRSEGNSYPNVSNSAREENGGQLESSLASLSLSSKTASDRKGPLTIETKREASSAPKSWASIASQPAKTGKTASLLKVKMAAASALTASTRPAPIVATLEAIGSWEAKNAPSSKSQIASPPFQSNMKHSPWSSSFSASSSTSSDPTPDQSCSSTSSGRDLPSSSSQSVASGNNITCNTSTSNNNNSSNTASSNSNSSNTNTNNTTTTTTTSTSNNNINNNGYCTTNSTSGCSFNGNNSSSIVAQRRPGPLTSSSSIESSVSSSTRASVNHHSSSTTNAAAATTTGTGTTSQATSSTTGAATGRQVHTTSIGGLRDARYEKENGYRESNNHYVNSHKRNWRESNVDSATVTDDTIGNSNSCSNNGPNNNCQNRVQKRLERTVSSNSEHVAHLEPVVDPSAIMDKQKLDNLFNPKEFDLNPTDARFFVIKSYSEDDIHRSIKYSIWCSTEHGNKRLDNAFKSQESKGPVYLFYSVNGSGHFCGMAQMMSGVDYDSTVNVWAQDKWKGQFKVKWIYVKDVPNSALRHIRLENNENKQVTNSRDTQEVPLEKGKQVLKIIHSYLHSTSIFDDFLHYEKKQEEEISRKIEGPGPLHRGQDSLPRPRKEPALTSNRENRHNQPESDGYPQHRDIHRDYRDPRDHRDHPPPPAPAPAPPPSTAPFSSTTHRGDYHRDYRNTSHKAPLQPSDREQYERRYDTTGDNSAHRDHRYPNHSVRNYDQGARDSHYQPRRQVHQHHHQLQGHAPHYHSNSSHHNQRTSWRE